MILPSSYAGTFDPQETITEIDEALGFVGEELRGDLIEPVAALDDDAGGAQNAHVLGGTLECRMANDEGRMMAGHKGVARCLI